MKLLAFFSLLLCQTSAFLVPITTKATPLFAVVSRNKEHDVVVEAAALSQNSNDTRETQQPPPKTPNGLFVLSSTTFTAAMASSPMVALAQVDPDDYEIAQLPPVWVPALFAVALLIGVGVLTSSLGDVMSEEASLGMQSGARAKKEMERSRSSYFKK
mmetsp:Transcript_10980/g.15405  ORF Transcript_10980/g.15405 Transcript_10980/m.15405 type:complete len:158 (-) Transcript_10980:104-577(-)